MKTMILAAAVLTLFAGSVRAESEGNGEPFPNRSGGRFAVATQVFNDTGSVGYIRNTRPVTGLANDEALPQTGSVSTVQTANSLPVGAEEGMTAYASALSMQRWVEAHELRQTRLASR